jgi:hypothetical protein
VLAQPCVGPACTVLAGLTAPLSRLLPGRARCPAGRRAAAAWADKRGRGWLFGGAVAGSAANDSTVAAMLQHPHSEGGLRLPDGSLSTSKTRYDITDYVGVLNDLWVFNGDPSRPAWRRVEAAAAGPSGRSWPAGVSGLLSSWTPPPVWAGHRPGARGRLRRGAGRLMCRGGVQCHGRRSPAPRPNRPPSSVAGGRETQLWLAVDEGDAVYGAAERYRRRQGAGRGQGALAAALPTERRRLNARGRPVGLCSA